MAGRKKKLGQDERADRRAQALRDNLLRRKAQARGRASADKSPRPSMNEAPVDDDLKR